MNEKDESQCLDEDATVYKEYTYRYLIVTLFCLLSFVSGMCWVVVSPISVTIAHAYNVSSDVVSIIPMSYMIAYVFVNFPSNWVLDAKGIKKGIVIGGVLTSIGAGIRCMVDESFYFVIIGQVICAIAQPFILNAPTKIAIRWFTPKNRSVALAVLSVINVIGTAAGFLIPAIFVDEQPNDTYNNNFQTRQQFSTLLWFQFFLCLIPTTLILLFFKERPPTMPSLGSSMESSNYLATIRSLFSDKKFLGMCFSFGTVMGSFCIYGSLLDSILKPYQFDADQVSYLAAIMLSTGVVSAALFGAYIQKTLHYRKVFILLGIIGFVQSIGLPLYLKIDGTSFAILVVIVFMQGVVFIPLMPLSFDYSCDILFPAGEAQITGTLMASGNLLGVLFTVISQQGLGLGRKSNSIEQDKDASFLTAMIVGSVTAVGTGLYCLYNAQLKRSILDQAGKEKKESMIGV